MKETTLFCNDCGDEIEGTYVSAEVNVATTKDGMLVDIPVIAGVPWQATELPVLLHYHPDCWGVNLAGVDHAE